MNPERTDDASPAGQPANRPSDAAPSAQKPVRMRAHIVERGGRIIDVTITELFANGCIVEAPEDLQPDDNVQLSILGSAAERAHVAWSKDGRAELRFERDSAGSMRRPRRTQSCRWFAKFHFDAPLKPLTESRYSTRRTWDAAASISIVRR